MRAAPPILLMFEPRRAGVSARSGRAAAGGRPVPRARRCDRGQKRSRSHVAGSLTECRPVSTRPAMRREKVAPLSAVTMKSYQWPVESSFQVQFRLVAGAHRHGPGRARVVGVPAIVVCAADGQRAVHLFQPYREADGATAVVAQPQMQVAACARVVDAAFRMRRTCAGEPGEVAGEAAVITVRGRAPTGRICRRRPRRAPSRRAAPCPARRLSGAARGRGAACRRRGILPPRGRCSRTSA